MKRSKKGLYILANDFVYDQLVALLNNIEVNMILKTENLIYYMLFTLNI